MISKRKLHSKREYCKRQDTAYHWKKMNSRNFKSQSSLFRLCKRKRTVGSDLLVRFRCRIALFSYRKGKLRDQDGRKHDNEEHGERAGRGNRRRRR